MYCVYKSILRLIYKHAYAQIWSYSVRALKSTPVLIFVQTGFDMEMCHVWATISCLNTVVFAACKDLDDDWWSYVSYVNGIN